MKLTSAALLSIFKGNAGLQPLLCIFCADKLKPEFQWLFAILHECENLERKLGIDDA